MPSRPSRPDAAARDRVAQRLGVVARRWRRRVERAQHGQRQAGAAAGRVDRDIDGVAKPLNPLARPGPTRPGPSSTARPSCSANSSGDMPARVRFGRIDPRLENPRAAAAGNVSSRLPRSPLGSMTIAGMPSIAASSSSARHRPVLPLPVMPTQTACVVRSLESYSSSSSVRLAGRQVVLLAQIEDAEAFEVLHDCAVHEFAATRSVFYQPFRRGAMQCKLSRLLLAVMLMLCGASAACGRRLHAAVPKGRRAGRLDP